MPPEYVHTLAPPSVHQISQCNLRSQRNIHIPRSRTNLYEDSFIPKHPKIGIHYQKVLHFVEQYNLWVNLGDIWIKDKTIVPNYFYFGQRKLQVIHTRLRLNCSSLGSDLLKNHISENADCLFYNVPQTAEHYLLHCNAFGYIRLQTINSLGIAVNVKILLKGCPLYD